MSAAPQAEVSAQLAMVAGEPSGDLLASHVLGALRRLRPELACAGIGGPRMRETGFDAWWPAERLAVNGFAAVLPRLPELLWVRASLRRRLLRAPPAVFVGVDAPDFNLALEARLRGAGIPTVHFVSPSIWAWRRERMQRIEQAVDHLLCVFPFEPALYSGSRVRATYIGHPLAEVIPRQPERAAARAVLGLETAAPLIALLPGSRAGEVAHIGPAFLGAAALLQRRRGARIALPVAHPGLAAQLRRQAAAHPELTIDWVDGESHRVLEACDLALVASGTATLECALYKRPMVIGYRLPELSWRLMKDRGYLPWVGLPNILAREFLVPELLQHDCNAAQLAAQAQTLLDDAARCEALRRRFEAMHEELLRPTARLAAQAIFESAGL
jgi:lipid-A-disaccharide synthase